MIKDSQDDYLYLGIDEHSFRRVDEARRIEQDVRRVRIPKKPFLVGKERIP